MRRTPCCCAPRGNAAAASRSTRTYCARPVCTISTATRCGRVRRCCPTCSWTYPASECAERLQPVGQAQAQRHDDEGGKGPAAGGKHRAVGDVQVGHAVHATVVEMERSNCPLHC